MFILLAETDWSFLERPATILCIALVLWVVSRDRS